jgi:hypothetical protein
LGPLQRGKKNFLDVFEGGGGKKVPEILILMDFLKIEFVILIKRIL